MWTRKSVLVTGAGVAALILGGVTKSWQAAGAGIAVLAFVCVNFFLYRKRQDVTATRELDLHRVFEADTVGVDATILNTGKRGVFMEVRDKLPRQVKIESGTHYAFIALKGGESSKLKYELRTPLLGVYAVGPLSLRLEDPFGLFYEERVAGAEDSLSVLPRTEDMRKAELLSNLPMPLLGDHQVNQPGDGFDFFALREYVAGDTIKMVNWKATAKTGKMMVNQLMRVTSSEVTVFFDGRAITAAGPEENSPRVQGARAAASIVNWVFGKKDMVRFVIYDDDVHEIQPAAPDRQMPIILETLAGHAPKGEITLEYAVRKVLPELKERTPFVLVSPLVDDATIVPAVAVLLANDMPAIVVSPRPVSFPGLDDEFARVLLADRERTLKALRGYGCFVIDLGPDDSFGAIMERGQVVSA